jgi:hypothetical protein
LRRLATLSTKHFQLSDAQFNVLMRSLLGVETQSTAAINKLVDAVLPIYSSAQHCAASTQDTDGADVQDSSSSSSDSLSASAITVDALIHWALEQCARHCVVTRLRTCYGK